MGHHIYMKQIEMDYLVVGAGAMGMAFVDTLLSGTQSSVVIVDRRDRPGGHWIDAYPFVRLHQPSSFYGVNSRELGQGTKDAIGLNQGLCELASGAEVVSYFDQIMRQRFLPSGRVRYFPMSNAIGDDEIESLLTGQRQRVNARMRVDATYSDTAIPATHPPRYRVSPGVLCVPLNDLPKIAQPQAAYVVVGAGKTGIDACLWLLERGVDPASIRWIMPRDAWLIDRARVQPGDEFFSDTFEGIARQMEAINAADDIPDLFRRLNAKGDLLRIDESVTPTMYCCATVTQAELAELRRIKGIVRLGRVLAIEPAEIVLERGRVPLPAGALVVDCSASAIPRKPEVPIWRAKHITLQMVRRCQPAFSAAFIGQVETCIQGEATKNALCAPVPPPNRDIDWLRMAIVDMTNSRKWSQNDDLRSWLAKSRLNSFYTSLQNVKPADTEKMALVQRFQQAARTAVDKLQQLLAAAGSA
jgi:hypothetical protein